MKPTEKITPTHKIPPEQILADALLRSALGPVSGPAMSHKTNCMSDMIVAMEKQGQAELVESNQLPTEGLLPRSEEQRKNPLRTVKGLIEAHGGKVLHETEGDPLFHDVVLPKGWKLVATDHAMWSKLVDEKGRERAGVRLPAFKMEELPDGAQNQPV
jgi:hypothetical protein